MTRFFTQGSTRSLIIKWALWWLAIMGLYTMVLKPMGINHKDNTLISNGYFVLMSFLGVKVFSVSQFLKEVFRPHYQFPLILISCIIFVSLPTMFAETFPLSPKSLKYLLESKFYFPLFETRISTVKAFDILFQQSLIFALVQHLKLRMDSKREIVFTFTLAFLAIHVPLFIVFGWLALIFIIPSLFAGIIFSFAILNYKFGLLYSFIVHLCFYLGAGLTFRLVN